MNDPGAKTRVLVSTMYAFLTMNAHHSQGITTLKNQFEEAFEEELSAPAVRSFTHIRRAMRAKVASHDNVRHAMR